MKWPRSKDLGYFLGRFDMEWTRQIIELITLVRIRNLGSATCAFLQIQFSGPRVGYDF